MSIRPILAGGLAAGLLLFGCRSPTALHRLEWIEVRSRHFTILSSMERAATLELARDLEIFRSLIGKVTGASLEDRVPTTIYAFRSSRSYAPFAPARVAVGHFRGGMRRNEVVIQGKASIEETAILKHEYVHFVLRNGSVAYPRWYDEGFAEFLATVQVEGDQVVIGMAPKWRFKAFSTREWVPVRRLLDVPPRMTLDDYLMFYTESWTLVHYLHFGRPGRKVSADLRRYMEETRGGTSPLDACERAFGLPVWDLDHELRQYFLKGRFPYVTGGLEGLGDDLELSVAPVSADRMAMELGWLSLAAERPDQARAYFEAVRAADPGNARALAGIGASAQQKEAWAEARAAFEAALAEGPDDALNHLDYARFLHARAEEEWDEGAEEQRPALERARSLYVKSWQLDATIPETYAMYGASFLLEGEEAAKGVETLEHAHRLLPSNLEIRLLLARAYAALGRDGPALDLAKSVAGWTHSADQREEAEDLIDELEARSG